MSNDDKIRALLEGPLRIVNIGLESFAAELATQGVDVVQVEWSPPAGGNPKLADLLAKMSG